MAVNLGALLHREGDVQAARTAYQRAIDSGHPDYAVSAVSNLGALLEDQGDVEGARAAYQRAIDSGRPECAQRRPSISDSSRKIKVMWRVHERPTSWQSTPGARTKLLRRRSVLEAFFEAQGDLEGAAAAYQQAIDSGHREQSPRAALLLGALLAAQRNPEGARAAFQRAIDSGHSTVSRWRYSILGSSLTGKGM